MKQNIGYPSQPAEVDFFIDHDEEGGTGMSEADFKTIEMALRNQKK